MPTSQDIRDQIRFLEQEYMTLARTEFTAKASALFDSCPDVRSIGWTQYTPYFNDGSECTFSANVSYPTINGYGDYTGTDADEGAINLYDSGKEQNYVIDPETSDPETTGGYRRTNYKYVPNPTFNRDHKRQLEEVKSFLQGFSEDFYREAFGDHKSVRLERGQTTPVVENYEHD